MDASTIEARVRVGEECGFESVWFMDHLAPPAAPQYDAFEGWTLASFLAARTTTIRLGHLVLCAPFRHPAVLAKMAATLDVLSGGRLELGLGWGSVPDELRRYGLDAQTTGDRVAWLEETLEVLTRMFSGEPFTFDGPVHSYVDAIGRPVPVQARVPIHLGGSGPKRTLPLVARYADWWNCPVYDVDRIDELRESIGNARISMQRVVALAPSTAARDEVVATAERRFGSWGGLIAGTPDEIAKALTEDAERGVELVVCQFSDFGTEDTLRVFAAEVMPAFDAG